MMTEVPSPKSSTFRGSPEMSLTHTLGDKVEAAGVDQRLDALF